MKNPFIVFGIDPTFQIDLNVLTVLYRRLVTEHHPDRGGDSNTMEDINNAYRRLKDPLKRAEILLENRGVAINHEETCQDPDLLSEVFELRLNPDPSEIKRKKEIATQSFEEAFMMQDVEGMLRFYWKLMYLQKINPIS